ncbi:hypothetical protein F4810DRAFT_661225 [Camillea tinctor]|nr:hypothetical protein F4810DRAFT_661225 [Camillea tinctor]
MSYNRLSMPSVPLLLLNLVTILSSASSFFSPPPPSPRSSQCECRHHPRASCSSRIPFAFSLKPSLSFSLDRHSLFAFAFCLCLPSIQP